MTLILFRKLLMLSMSMNFLTRKTVNKEMRSWSAAKETISMSRLSSRLCLPDPMKFFLKKVWITLLNLVITLNAIKRLSVLLGSSNWFLIITNRRFYRLYIKLRKNLMYYCSPWMFRLPLVIILLIINTKLLTLWLKMSLSSKILPKVKNQVIFCQCNSKLILRL